MPNSYYPYPDDGANIFNPGLNAVCFKCTFVARYHRRNRPDNHKTPTCPHCQQKMICLFCKFKIPRKTNRKAWKLLEKQYT